MHLATKVLDNLILLHRIPSYILTDKGTHLVSKFIKTLRIFQGAESMMTTDYHPETNGQVEQYIRT